MPTVTRDQIIQWAQALGRPDLVDWATQYVAQKGRLPQSLSELPQSGGGGAGGGGSYPGPGGFDYAGGSSLLDPAMQAQQALVNARNWQLGQGGLGGWTPSITDADVNYYDLLKDIPTADATAWTAEAARRTGLDPRILQSVYQRGGLARGMPDQAAFGRIVENAAATAVPSMAREFGEAGIRGYYDGGTPTFAREAWKAQEDRANAQQTGYTAATTLPADYLARHKAWTADFKAKTGRVPTQDEWAQAYASITGQPVDVGRQMYQKGLQYQQTMGKEASQAEVEQWAQQAGQQRPKTWERESGEAAEERLLAGVTGQHRGQDTLAAQEFKARTGLDLLQLLSQQRGPENAFQYEQMRSAAAGTPAAQYAGQLAGGGAWGGWGQGQPASIVGLLSGGQSGAPGQGAATSTPGQTMDARVQQEPNGTAVGASTGQQRASDYLYRVMGAQGPRSTTAPAPWKTNARNLTNMSGYQQKMAGSALQSLGYDPEDYFQTAQKAMPRGQAATRTRW